ncbi:hypothetical protein [Stappia indica]|nr:hypothetical protein [Stappia indica]
MRQRHRRHHREERFPVARAIAFAICLAAVVGALFWRAKGW